MIELRDYQLDGAKKGHDVLKEHKVLILNYEVRCGKTHIALKIADWLKQKALFVTKKKAISSIENDIIAAEYKGLDITVINYEQLHKYGSDYGLIICDESHSLGAFPKPTLRVKELKRICKNNPYIILMTGTLLPESNAQIFHQLYIAEFWQHPNFYKWHNEFGIEKVKYTSYGTCKDYSHVPYDRIEPFINPIMLTYTQQQAGFISEIKENILTVQMKESTYKVIDRLKKDLVVEGKKGVVLADTAVKLMQKCHQLYSGTIKFEDGSRTVFDDTKSKFIADHFYGKKLAIFYKFIAELEAIKMHLNITQDIEEFNNSDKHIALQIVSGREGINLSKADVLIYYNIDFSAVSYWQSRDRMTTIKRSESQVYWIFSSGGIEHQIYKAVSKKKDFVLRTFKAWQVSTKQK